MGVMLLPVALSETEKVAVGVDLCRAITALEDAKAAKKAANATHNETIKNLEGSVHGLKESLASGTVDREVEVDRRPIPFAGKVAIFRMDRNVDGTPPGELVREETMDDDERQLRLGDTALPGGKKGTVTNLADHARTEEQQIASTPEEAEEIRAQRLADESGARVEAIMAALGERVVVEPRGDKFLAKIEGKIDGLPGRGGFSGPIRATAEESTSEMLAQVRQMLEDQRPWMEAAEVSRQNEVEKLADQQAADDAQTKPKRLLKVPRGHKSKKLKITDGADNPIDTGADLPAPGPNPPPDTTPPPDGAF